MVLLYIGCVKISQLATAGSNWWTHWSSETVCWSAGPPKYCKTLKGLMLNSYRAQALKRFGGLGAHLCYWKQYILHSYVLCTERIGSGGGVGSEVTD